MNINLCGWLFLYYAIFAVCGKGVEEFPHYVVIQTNESAFSYLNGYYGKSEHLKESYLVYENGNNKLQPGSHTVWTVGRKKAGNYLLSEENCKFPTKWFTFYSSEPIEISVTKQNLNEPDYYARLLYRKE